MYWSEIWGGNLCFYSVGLAPLTSSIRRTWAWCTFLSWSPCFHRLQIKPKQTIKCNWKISILWYVKHACVCCSYLVQLGIEINIRMSSLIVEEELLNLDSLLLLLWELILEMSKIFIVVPLKTLPMTSSTQFFWYMLYLLIRAGDDADCKLWVCLPELDITLCKIEIAPLLIDPGSLLPDWS